MSAEYNLDRFINFTSSGKCFQSATLASAIATNTSYDFLTFLGIAQTLNLEFLPISWDTGQATIGQGGTAEISQSSVNLETAFAFKRLTSVDADSSEAKKTARLKALVAEIFVLGHKSVRGHPNITRLEGICWDIEPERETVWPVLVFEKTEHGDLGTFMKHSAGRNMDLRNRLKLCTGIATAISHMHLNGIIHGDIKPANILIHQNDQKQFVPRVTDFGYSTWLGGADDMVFMPRTLHWTAPEWHHRGITSTSAVKMDIYSFGLLCLWLLFYRDGETTSTLAHQLVMEMPDVSDEQRHNLHNLFNMSLAVDPAQRCSSLGHLVGLLEPAGIPESRASENIVSDQPELTKDFRGSYLHRRVPKEKASKSSALAHTSQCAAFELAFCYTLGFGVNKDDATASALLRQANRSLEELTDKINRVRHGRLRSHPRQSVYSQSLYLGHTITMSTGGGRYYREKGTLDEAASHIRKEIIDVEDVVGAEHRIIRSLKSTLTKILILQERWEEAQKIETQVLQCSSKTLGERHPDTMSSRSSLAVIHSKQKHWKEAELLQKQAMTASLTELGLDHGVTLSSMNSLALTFAGQGRWEEAERLEKQVLQISKDALGLEHPNSLDSAEHLNEFRKEQDLWERLEMKAVEYEQSGTSLILPTIATYSSLESLREREQSEEYALRLLEIKERVLGREHPLVLNMLMSRAMVYQEQGRYKEAEEKALEVVKIRQKKAPSHPSTVTAMIRLGSIYYSQGRWKDAEVLQLQTLDASSKMAANASETLLVMSHLALNYSRQGRLSEAERLQVEIMEANMTELGREDLISLNSMACLSLTYMRQGRWDDAEVLALQVANSRQAILGPENPVTLAGLGNLVSVYKGQERWEEAESLATQVMNKRKKTLGDSHPKTLRTMRDLAVIWQAQKRHEEALALMSRVVDLSETVLGLGHPDTVSRKQDLDIWGSQPYQDPSTGNDQREGTYPNLSSQGPSTLVHENFTQTPQVTTESTRTAEPAVNYKTYSGIRKPDLRRRQMLKSFERQLVSNNVPQGFKQKLQKRIDLLIEYGVD